ncbi:MAG: hypothetical protein AABY02_00160 [Nanoarchaeota archaeon]
MEEPKTKVFIIKKDKKTMECFIFPFLTDESPRLKNKKIVDIQTKNGFGKEWLDTPDEASTRIGNLIQSITYEDGEIIERIVQVRADGTHHAGSKFHINIDVQRREKIKSEDINYKKEIENHFMRFDIDRMEEVWVGIGYNGETTIQIIAFVSTPEQKSYADKQKEVFRQAIHKASVQTGIGVDKL